MSGTKIRPLKSEDSTELATLANNIKIWNNVRDYFPNPYSLSDAQSFIHSKQQESPTLTLAIEYQGNLAGVIGLEPKTDVFRITSIVGYWIGEPYWGKGIATAALNLLVQYAFMELDIVRLEAGHFDFNAASGRVMEKCGFKKFGIAKKAAIKNNVIVDDHLYELINPKYQYTQNGWYSRPLLFPT